MFHTIVQTARIWKGFSSNKPMKYARDFAVVSSRKGTTLAGSSRYVQDLTALITNSKRRKKLLVSGIVLRILMGRLCRPIMVICTKLMLKGRMLI